MLYAATKQAILEPAKEVYPEEACGYIVGDRGRERYMRSPGSLLACVTQSTNRPSSIKAMAASRQG